MDMSTLGVIVKYRGDGNVTISLSVASGSFDIYPTSRPFNSLETTFMLLIRLVTSLLLKGFLWLTSLS